MDTNKIIALLGVGVIGLMLYKQINNGNSTEKRFRLPDGRVVFESELGQYGYVKTPSGWIDQNLFNQAQSRLRNGEAWESIMNAIQQFSYLNWSALFDENGNRVDINEPFSTTPTDWGMDDWGNMAGVKLKKYSNEFLY